MFQLHFIYIVIPCNHSYSIVIFLVSSNRYRISAISFHFIRVTISCYQICKSFLASYFESNLSLLRLEFLHPPWYHSHVYSSKTDSPSISYFSEEISNFFLFSISSIEFWPISFSEKGKKKENIANIIHFHEIELKSLHDKIGSFISNNIHVSSILDEFFFSKI